MGLQMGFAGSADVCCRDKYVAPATKKVILVELRHRATSVEEANTVVDSVVFRAVPTLLLNPNATVRDWTCEILGRLAVHESAAMAILGLQPCDQVVSLLR